MKTKKSQTSRVSYERGTRNCCLFLFLFVALNGVCLAGKLDLGSKVSINGTLDMATAFGNEGVPQLHEFIRGDSLFDPTRLRFFGDVAFNRRLTLFNQFLIDPDIRFGQKTFLRSYLRFNFFETQNPEHTGRQDPECLRESGQPGLFVGEPTYFLASGVPLLFLTQG